MTVDRFVDLGEPAQRGHNVEPVAVAEYSGHRHRASELLEVFRGWLVCHFVDDDEGV